MIDRLGDAKTFFEIKKLFAPELITGFAKLGGRAVGILANQPKVKGGVLFVDSADKGARFMWLCNAFNIPLLFLADVPGFMIGTKVERAGIIRAGAKMISAVSSADVPKISVVLRKAYGAGLYAMCGPAFEPVWINEPGDAAPSLEVLAERQTAVDALVIPFWEVVCADARTRQVQVEGGVCMME